MPNCCMKADVTLICYFLFISGRNTTFSCHCTAYTSYKESLNASRGSPIIVSDYFVCKNGSNNFKREHMVTTQAGHEIVRRDTTYSKGMFES